MTANLRKVLSKLQPMFMSLLLICGGMGGPLVFATESRLAELHQNIPASERSEEVATLSRFDHERQIKQEQRLSAIIFEISANARLGHAQNIVLFVPAGHRLSNGLLAPITC